MIETQRSPTSDEQYDMIDDLSEISNDDHDTASIGSNDQEHISFSPRIGSDVDESVASSVLESFADLTDTQQSDDKSSTHLSHPEVNQPLLTSTPSESQTANDLIDSYSSEDMETPRQSSSETTFKSTWRQALHQSASQPKPSSITPRAEGSQRAKQILFVSDISTSLEELDSICVQVAAGLDDKANKSSDWKVARLPETPSGISLSTSTVVYDGERVSATIQHCVGAEERRDHSFQLRVQDTEGTLSTLFTIGSDGKVDLEMPDIVVFYIEQGFRTLDSWFGIASDAVKQCSLPTLVVLGSKFTTGSFSNMAVLAREVDQGRAVHVHDFTNTAELKRIQKRTRKIVATQKTHALRESRKIGLLHNMLKPSYLTFALFFLACLTWPFTLRPVDAIVANIARRNALETALAREPFVSQVAKAFNIDHLLPEPPQGCTSMVVLGHELTQPACATDVRYQGLSPNYILLSLPGQTRFPQIQTVMINRSDENCLQSNITQLIDGVYCVTLDPKEAHGTINLRMTTAKPHLHIDLSHNFGNRMLQLHTYQEVGTDVSKAVGKDLAVIRHTAQSLSERFVVELGQCIAATHDITTNTARYVTRDLQVISDTAIAIYDQVLATSNMTIAIITKDYILVQQGFMHFVSVVCEDLKAKVDAIKVRTAARKSLRRSRKTLKRLENVLRHQVVSDDARGDAEGSSSTRGVVADGGDASKLPGKSTSPHIETAVRAVDRAQGLLKALRKRLKIAERDGALSKQHRKDMRELRKKIRTQERDVLKLEKELSKEKKHMGTA
jgi:hypothetical protein